MKLSEEFKVAMRYIEGNFSIFSAKETNNNNLSVEVKFGNGDSWYTWTILNTTEKKYAIMRLKTKAMQFNEQIVIQMKLRSQSKSFEPISTPCINSWINLTELT